MPDDRDELIGFYADPVDEDGNVIARVTFDVRTSGMPPVRMVKIPHDEMALPGDAPMWVVGDD